MLFLVLIVCFGASTGQAQIAAPIHNYANHNDSLRVFFTNLTVDPVMAVFDPNFPTNFPYFKDLGMGILIENRAEWNCPDMKAIHSIVTSQGQLKFEKPELITATDTDFGVAGYLAPTPGYCNSAQIELIEFYSPIMNAYRYDNVNNIMSYYTDYTYYYRPVRTMGFVYAAKWGRKKRSDKQNGFAHNTVAVNFDVVRKLRKGDAVSYAISSSTIQTLIADGYKLSRTALPGPLSGLTKNVSAIESKCGPLHKCVETFDPKTGVYLPQNAETQEMQGKRIVADCGFFLSKKAAKNCFPRASEHFTHVKNNAKHTAVYANGMNATADYSVGYAFPYIFSFVKL